MHPSVTTVYHSSPLAMGTQSTLTIDSIRLGGIDVALAIMEEQYEDIQSTIHASRWPSIVSVGNERDTLMLLDEFECLAAKTKTLPVSPKRPDLPATRRLDNSTALPLQSRTRPTFTSREIFVDDLGRTHVSSSAISNSSQESFESEYSSSAGSVLSGSTACEYGMHHRHKVSPAIDSTRSVQQPTSKLHTRVPPVKLTPCRQLPRPPVTTQTHSEQKPDITRPPAALLTRGGVPIKEVNCSKPLPPLPPSKLFALKRIFKCQNSKPNSELPVRPLKPIKYTNAWGSPVQNVPPSKKGRETPSTGKGITTGSKCNLKKIFKKTQTLAQMTHEDDSFLDMSS